MKKEKIIFYVITVIIVLGVILFAFFGHGKYLNSKSLVLNKNAVLSDIKYSKDKINLYIFWGDGCPHCEEEFSYLEDISKDYKDYVRIYGFEVWYNKENAELLKTFSDAMGDEIKGVPYTIIGDKSYTGFDKNDVEDMIKQIKDNHNNSFDIYKKIKNNEK